MFYKYIDKKVYELWLFNSNSAYFHVFMYSFVQDNLVVILRENK